MRARAARRAAGAALLIALALAGGLPTGAGISVLTPVVAAAQPTSSPAAAGDTRSAGEGPGLVGAPLVAVLGVLAIGLLTALATLLYVRLTAARSGQSEDIGT